MNFHLNFCLCLLLYFCNGERSIFVLQEEEVWRGSIGETIRWDPPWNITSPIFHVSIRVSLKIFITLNFVFVLYFNMYLFHDIKRTFQWPLSLTHYPHCLHIIELLSKHWVVAVIFALLSLYCEYDIVCNANMRAGTVEPNVCIIHSGAHPPATQKWTLGGLPSCACPLAPPPSSMRYNISFHPPCLTTYPWFWSAC